MGAGAIGGLIAGRLALGGRDVAVASRHRVDALVLEDGSGSTPVPVRMLHEPAVAGPSRWVVLATKTYDVEAASGWLDRVVGPDTIVAVAQNGIDHHERVQRWADRERVVPLIVRHGAARPAPGVVRHTLSGSITVPATPAGREFATLSDGAGLAVQVSEDFERELWTKLAWNLVGNSISTIVDVAVREIGLRQELRTLAGHLVEECRAAALAEGVDLAPGLVDDIVDTMARYDPEVRSSMWQDRHAGRRFEHAAISGAVARAARRHGRSAPYSDMATLLLESMSAGGGRDARTH